MQLLLAAGFFRVSNKDVHGLPAFVLGHTSRRSHMRKMLQEWVG